MKQAKKKAEVGIEPTTNGDKIRENSIFQKTKRTAFTVLGFIQKIVFIIGKKTSIIFNHCYLICFPNYKQKLPYHCKIALPGTEQQISCIAYIGVRSGTIKYPRRITLSYHRS